MSRPPGNLTPTPASVGTPPGARHFRRRPEALRRFWKDRPSRFGLLFLLFAFLAAVLAPLLVGTRPIVCKYKQEIHFPFLSAYTGGSDRGVFLKDGFGGVYPSNLRQNDAQSWAVWPLFYKDPLRRIEPDEWEGDPGDGARKPPSLRNWFGTDEMGRDVFARVLYGTRTAFLVGLVSMAIAGAQGMLVAGGVSGPRHRCHGALLQPGGGRSPGSNGPTPEEIVRSAVRPRGLVWHRLGWRRGCAQSAPRAPSSSPWVWRSPRARATSMPLA